MKRTAKAAALPLPPPTVRRNPPRGAGKANYAELGSDSDESSSERGSPINKSPSRPLLPVSSASSSSSSSAEASATATAAAVDDDAPSEISSTQPRFSPSPPIPPGRQIPVGLTSPPREGSILWDPIPRRGAPRNAGLHSLFSSPKRDSADVKEESESESEEDYDRIPSSPPPPKSAAELQAEEMAQHEIEESEEESEEDYGRIPSSSPPPKSAAELQAEEMAQHEIEEAEVDMWVDAGDVLVRDATRLINLLAEKSTRLAYKPIVRMWIQSFDKFRGSFQETQPRSGGLFLAWDWMKKIGDDESLTKEAMRLGVKLSNIATALLHMRAIEEQDQDPIAFLEAMDECFPQSFEADESKHSPPLSLEIRTQRAIESIAISPYSADRRGMLGYAFCSLDGPDAPSDYPTLFAQGPYKPMAGLDEDALLDVCSERVKDIWHIVSEGGQRGIRSPLDLPAVRAKYPLAHTLELLNEWLLRAFESIWEVLSKIQRDCEAVEQQMLREQWQAEVEARHGHDEQVRQEERQREDEWRAKEMDKLRAGQEALEKERQAWKRESFLRARKAEERLPREEEDNSLLFFSDRDSRSASPQSLASSQGGSQRPQIQRGGGDDDASGDDSLFPRNELASLLVSLSAPVPAAPGSTAPAASSSTPDLAEISRLKAEARANARLSNPRKARRRQAWSERDSVVLIELVASRAACWSEMYQQDRHRFEQPRDAQAYRDRARNLKVDLIISDAVLPRGFDLVALGKKETDRLEKLGKNPGRLETDIDGNGRPTNTEFVRPAPGVQGR